MPTPILRELEPDRYVAWFEFCRQKKIEEAKRQSDKRKKEDLEKEAQEIDRQKKMFEQMFRDAVLCNTKVRLEQIQERKEKRKQERDNENLDKFIRRLSEEEFSILERIETMALEFFREEKNAEFEAFREESEREKRLPLWKRKRDLEPPREHFHGGRER
jgi:phosphoenolpyruvate carboxylase